MNKKDIVKRAFLGILILLVSIAAFSIGAMLLWNWLMPAIFGLPAITYLRALGLMVLARILLSGFPFSERKAMIGAARRNPIREKWMNMTEEERSEFIKREHGLHGFFHDHGEKHE
jgi:hypothetical protein